MGNDILQIAMRFAADIGQVEDLSSMLQQWFKACRSGHALVLTVYKKARSKLLDLQCNTQLTNLAYIWDTHVRAVGT